MATPSRQLGRKTRREFLEDSMFAATAALGTYGVAAQTFAADKKAVGPNDKLRVAILGVNGRGQAHLSAFLGNPQTDVVAIVDPDDNVGQQKGVARVAGASGKKPAFYQDLRKAMDDKNIDIVSIATPNHWHALAAIWAIQAGKDVYVEKPVSHNVSEGRRIVQAARKHNRICQAGTQCRSMAGTVDMIKFVHAGGIGEVKLARGLCYKRRPSIGPKGNYDVPAGVDYSVWLGPAPEAPLSRPRFHYDWHWQWPYGNGDLGNQGIHQMDIARWGLNVDGLGDSVLSYGGRLGYVDAGTTANTQVCVHNFGDKRLVFETRGLVTDAYKGSKVGVVFHGTKGYAVQLSYDRSAAFDLDGNMIKSFEGGGDHFQNFLDAVHSRNHEDLAGDIEEGHLSSALCHLGNISLQSGKAESAKEIGQHFSGDAELSETFERTAQHLADNEVDLAKAKIIMGPKLELVSGEEVFKGDRNSAVNAMLTREYRAPFVVPTENNV